MRFCGRGCVHIISLILVSTIFSTAPISAALGIGCSFFFSPCISGQCAPSLFFSLFFLLLLLVLILKGIGLVSGTELAYARFPGYLCPTIEQV